MAALSTEHGLLVASSLKKKTEESGVGFTEQWKLKYFLP